MKKIKAVWNALLPDVQNVILAAAAVAAMILLLWIFGCTAPVRTADSSGVQETIKHAAESLKQADTPAAQRAAVIEAQGALDQCSRLLWERDRQVNQCAGQVRKLTEDLNAAKADRGFWSAVNLRWHWFTGGFVTAVVLAIAVKIAAVVRKLAA